MARKEKVVQFTHKVPTVSWRQPEHDSHEKDCVECGEQHKRNSKFCSFYCQTVALKEAA